MWEILGGLLVGTAISGVLPIVNAEALVLVASAAVPQFAVPLVALASAAGQMSSKTSLFALARWAPTRLPHRARSVLARASGRVEARGERSDLWSSPVPSRAVPPFYGVSLATGALGMRLRSFVLNGFGGRLVRFGAIAWAGNRFGDAVVEVLRDRGVTVLLLGG